MSITRCIVRWGLVSGLALGGMTLLVGPQRMHASLHHVRTQVQGVVDMCVDNPEALRRQLEELADEYPERIEEVSKELAIVDTHIDEIQSDLRKSTLVVSAMTDDLGLLKRGVEQANAKRAEGIMYVKLELDGMRLSPEQAINEASRLLGARESYQDRIEFDQRQLVFLQEQREALSEALTGLEGEFASFEAKMWQLDREIDAIERNERLIELTKRQQQTLDSYNKFEKVGNFRQIESKLAQLRTVQDAQMQVLRERAFQRDYEAQAEMQITLENDGNFEIETVDASASESITWNGPVVIELD
jgi:chromosome segregation ATPase